MIVGQRVLRDTPIVAKVERAGQEWAVYLQLPDGSSYGKVHLVKSRNKAISKARSDLASFADLVKESDRKARKR